MLFNAPEFLFGFLPAFLIAYFVAPRRGRNLVLFLASLLFYFATSGELTLVLIASVIGNHFLAHRIWRAEGPARRAWLLLGIGGNLAPLLWYKYAGFALLSLSDALRAAGMPQELPRLHVALPIGISFFTFQALSYIADVYMRRIAPARRLVDFGMYHSCFPQLIAGPIVRYEEIAHEVPVDARTGRRTSLDDLYNGAVRFCLGLGKKVILADTLGQIADPMFAAAPAGIDALSAWLGILAYTLQIYFDFSGYSDMAIGLGRMLGFTYPENFDQPYRARSITEFWQRWHMTLSRWFRDYVYIPLGGNRAGLTRTLVNLLAVFLLCGLWHGAAYTFVIWGLYHGALLVAERLARRWTDRRLPAPIAWVFTCLAVMIGWVFFRAESVPAAMTYLSAMFSLPGAALPDRVVGALTGDRPIVLAVALIAAFVPYRHLVDFAGRRYRFAPAWSAVSLCVFACAVVLMSASGFSPFIYFQF